MSTTRFPLALALGIALLAACSTPTGGSRPGASGAAPASPAASAATTSAAAPAAAPAAPSGPLNPPVAVRFGDLPSTSNAAIYIAMERGYFQEEGLNVT